MLTALTGTPGAGKRTVARVLAQQGIPTVSLPDLAISSGARREYDSRRKTWNVDLNGLVAYLPRVRPLVLVGHFAHLIPVDMAIVLRCHPEVLRKRLASRGWDARKVHENVEAEAIGVITAEAMGRVETFELDTTKASPEETANGVLGILKGEGEDYRAGKIDWSEVILSWY